MSDAVAKLMPLVKALTYEERAMFRSYLADLARESAYAKLTPEEQEEVWGPEISRRTADAEAGEDS